MQRNNVKTDFAICKLPRWVIITIRDVADYYSVDQASVLRACIQACERKDVLIELPKQPLPYLNKGVAYPLKASFEDQEHIRYWEERLSWTKKTVLASMIITGLPPVIERLKHSKPLVSRLIRNNSGIIYCCLNTSFLHILTEMFRSLDDKIIYRASSPLTTRL